MPKQSAGVLLFRRKPELEVLLAHPGGPLWTRKDAGVWTIPKGEYGSDEDALGAAKRELAEELGTAFEGEFLPLGEIRQLSGKRVTAWALEAEFDPATLHSSRFEIEWPPRSGKLQHFPEVDRVEWYTLPQARKKLLAAQNELLDRLMELMRGSSSSRS